MWQGGGVKKGVGRGRRRVLGLHVTHNNFIFISAFYQKIVDNYLSNTNNLCSSGGGSLRVITIKSTNGEMVGGCGVRGFRGSGVRAPHIKVLLAPCSFYGSLLSVCCYDTFVPNIDHHQMASSFSNFPPFRFHIFPHFHSYTLNYLNFWFVELCPSIFSPVPTLFIGHNCMFAIFISYRNCFTLSRINVGKTYPAYHETDINCGSYTASKYPDEHSGKDSCFDTKSLF